MTQPKTVERQRAAALRFGDKRVHALLSALTTFHLLPNGFSNRDLRAHVAPLLGLAEDSFSVGRMTYDLRRLRLHGLIERIPGTYRYRVTPLGGRVALFFCRAYNRFVRNGLSQIADPKSDARLAKLFRQLDKELTLLATRASAA